MARILVVEDQRFARNYISALLTRAGHGVREAEDGMKALEIARTSRPDLVISDLLMPGMDGYELVQELRRDALLRGIPAIFLSAEYVEAEARILGRRLGVSQFLVKPVDPKRLLSAIDAALHPGATPTAASAGLEADPLDKHVRLLTSKLYETVLVRDREIERRKLIEEELRAANALLQIQAKEDPVTSLPNRRYWEECVTREIGRARRHGQRLGLMMMDIDHFKRFNDEFGHRVGDEVLRAVAKRLQAQVRAEDILCRYAGDEFALLLVNADAGLSEKRAHQLRAAASQMRIQHGGRSIDPVRLSVGVAMFPADGDSPAVLIKAADSALHDAKRLGRDRVTFCSRP